MLTTKQQASICAGASVRVLAVLLACFGAVLNSAAYGAGAEDRVVAPTTGEITLLFDEYQRLLEQIAAAEAERLRLVEKQEPPLAEVSRTRAELLVDDDGVTGVYRFEVRVGGRELKPVPLAVTGLVTASKVSQSGGADSKGASLSFTSSGLELIAKQAGTFEVVVDSYVAFADPEATLRALPLAPIASSVGSVAVDLDADLIWECAEATLVSDVERNSDAVDGPRRLIELALPKERSSVLRLRRPFASTEAERALVHATTATVLDIDRHGITRTDLAVFDVTRGSLASHSITLPDGLDPESIGGDEGRSVHERRGSTVEVYRNRLLEATGFVSMQTPVQHGEVLDLAPVQTEFESRGHYLILRSGLAAKVEPEQAGNWTVRDETDLPTSLADRSSKALSVWQLNDGAEAGPLSVELVKEAKGLGAVVRRRESTSLLTVDGSLVHREILQVVGRGSALEVTLPEGSELWSMLLDGVPSRPLERAGKVYAPLSLANDGTRTIEIVSVQAQAVPDERAQVELQLAVLSSPVLEHQWRLLLPDGKRYRFAEGSLRPQTGIAPEDRGLDLGRGTGAVQGRVTMSDGSLLPGVTVSLIDSKGQTHVQITNRQGWYFFRGLPGGKFTVRAELDGFSSVNLPVRVRSSRTTLASLLLSPSVEETITVTSEAPLLDERAAQSMFEQDAAELRQKAYADEAQALMSQAAPVARDRVDRVNVGGNESLGSGKRVGVRPLSVQIPERGKVFAMIGVLADQAPWVRLDVKNGR